MHEIWCTLYFAFIIIMVGIELFEKYSVQPSYFTVHNVRGLHGLAEPLIQISNRIIFTFHWYNQVNKCI